MRRARHSSALPVVVRHRALILLVVAAVGLALALWLPTRQDSASAKENSGDRHSVQDRRERGHGHHGRHRENTESSSEAEWSSEAKSSSETERSSDSESRSASLSERSPGATTRPPTERSPSRNAPRATKWAPFTHYVAGQLVTFNGVTYRVRETHTALPGWDPPKIPTLFRVV